MTGREIYKIWAPTSCIWSPWVRPVPFVAIDDHYENHEFINFCPNQITYLEKFDKSTAIIVDLPGYESIEEGIALTNFGYRPIPLYNGTNEQPGVMATTNNREIELGLIWGSYILSNTKIKKDAPPVFLLDSNRMNRYQMNHSVFDNSWDIYHQDMPSKDFFKKNGIKKIIVRGIKFNIDLQRILYKFQKNNIKIYYTDGYSSPKEYIIKKPKEDNLKKVKDN
ncbi:MAG: hypothetical protein IJN90_01320 [Bacilli bacterium]|nr:hypothetical protein [Bacilli bacterium]